MKKMKKKSENEQFLTRDEFLKIIDEIKYSNFESSSSGEE
jgi:hypothetical protein